VNPPHESATDVSTIEQLTKRLGALEDQLSRLRELTLRSYENTPLVATELLRARRRSDYAAAFLPRPLVTVRVGAYKGGEALFTRALASVRAQTYTNWEAVVVCDGRDEATAERIASLGDSRVRCVQRPRNGPYPSDAAARWLVAGSHPFNEAFSLARGSWIAPIDQDDRWTDDHLDVLLKTAKHSRAEVVYGVSRVIVGGRGETYFGSWPPALGDFGFQSAIHHACLTAFLYDVNAHIAGEPADWNLARRMLEAGVRFDFVEQIVTDYYVGHDAPRLPWWQDRARQRGQFRPD
jgi:glycosyltransferase involved in cell wall biosynthesis